MTSELRELVTVPNVSAASRTSTSRPASASSRATASPTAPAPMTAQSQVSSIPPSPFSLFARRVACPEHPPPRNESRASDRWRRRVDNRYSDAMLTGEEQLPFDLDLGNER